MRKQVFFVKSSENLPGCPCCGGQLRYRDSRLRIRKHEGGRREHICISRFKCISCGKFRKSSTMSPPNQKTLHCCRV